MRHPLASSVSYFNGIWRLTNFDSIEKRGQGNVFPNFPVEIYKEENFAEKFLKVYLQYWKSFHDKLLEYCLENCEVVFYEDLKKDIIGQMTKILGFLNSRK